MKDVSLYLWDISVAVSIFGYGMLGLRLLGLRRSSPAVAGVFGVSLWIAVGGVLNLLHLLRPGVFFALVATGIGFVVLELWLRRRESGMESAATARDQKAAFSIPAKIAIVAAMLLIVTFIVGEMRIRHWSNDDFEGYLAIAMKSAEHNSLQPDPFSERRVNVGVGGGTFLDTLMFATGDVRAMNFIDSSFGFGLYALAVWAIGRRWKVPPLGIALTVLCIPLAPLFKINLTIVYISVAGFMALLLLLTDAPDEEPYSAGRVIALGVIVGANLTTKTTNLVFVMPMLLGVVLLHRLFHARRTPLLPLMYALLVALAVFVPWSIAAKVGAGTYLYPLLGLGDHVSAYHLIWTQSKTGSWQQLIVVTAPNFILLSLCFAVAWKLTRHWLPAARAAVLAYTGAAIVALPVCIYGLGEEFADRYSAPLVMPVYLLMLLLVLGATPRIPALWRYAGVLTLAAAGLYTVLFIDIHLMWLFETKTVLYQAFGKLPHHKFANVFILDDAAIQKEFAYGAGIQDSIPVGATALDVSNRSFHFDFRRNTIFIADILGMASPPPGLPLDSTPAAQKQFLIDHGVDYLIYERNTSMSCDYNTQLKRSRSEWPQFLVDQREHFSFSYLLKNETFAHSYGPWNIVEFFVPCHERSVLEEIISASPQVYHDDEFVVARLH